MSSADKSKRDEVASRLLREFEECLAEEQVQNIEGIAGEILSLAGENTEEEQSQEFELLDEANRYESDGDWMSAKTAYHQVVESQNVAPLSEFRAHSDLSALHRILREWTPAVRHAHMAKLAAQRAEMPMFVASALHSEARCWVLQDRTDKIDVLVREMVSIDDDDPLSAQMNAKTMVFRAEFELSQGHFLEAEKDLEKAFNYLKPLSSVDIMAGIHADLARWWSVTASLRAAQGDVGAAIGAWQEAVDRSKHVLSLRHDENVHSKVLLAEMLGGLAKSLELTGPSDDVARIISERHRILVDCRLAED